MMQGKGKEKKIEKIKQIKLKQNKNKTNNIKTKNSKGDGYLQKWRIKGAFAGAIIHFTRNK